MCPNCCEPELEYGICKCCGYQLTAADNLEFAEMSDVECRADEPKTNCAWPDCQCRQAAE